MFKANDVIVQKEKVALKLKVKIRIKSEKIIVSKLKLEFSCDNQTQILSIYRFENSQYNKKILTIIKTIIRLHSVYKYIYIYLYIFKVLYGHLRKTGSGIGEISSLKIIDSS